MSVERENANDSSGAARPGVPERRYRKPPVIEALCEFYFSGSSWDDTIPGRFYERIKDRFPTKRQRTIQEAQITLGPEHSSAGIRQLPPWMQFVSEEKHRMIQLARDLLVVNQLAPYPHFEEWEPDVFHALRIYAELAQPKNIVRLGLRYLNRVVIPGASCRMEDYFTIYPNLPQRLGNTVASFLVRVEVPQTEQGHTLVITFGNAPPLPAQEPGQAFMLDFYDLLSMNQAVDEEILKREIETAHDNIVVAFEGSITDKLRALFEPEEEV